MPGGRLRAAHDRGRGARAARNPLRRRGRRVQGRAARSAPRARSCGELRPDAVMGGGGYVAGPVGLAAVLLRIPLVLTEADSHLGLTNRLLARVRAARLPRVPDRRAATATRYRVTGPPGAAAVRPTAPPRARASASARTRACVLVFGGSLGRALDQRGRGRGVRRRAVPRPARRGHARLRRAARPRPARRRYDLRAYIDARSARRSLAADLVVARAGGSIFEIAAHGRPAILVPIRTPTADHQTANARWMADAGAAVVIARRRADARRGWRTRSATLLRRPARAWRRWAGVGRARAPTRPRRRRASVRAASCADTRRRGAGRVDARRRCARADSRRCPMSDALGRPPAAPRRASAAPG